MTSWTVNASGNQVFNHEGWEVQIWGPEWPNSRITVSSPHSGEEVEVSERGIWVYGESGGGWEGPSASAVTIPWSVVEAIIEARRIVDCSKSEEPEEEAMDDFKIPAVGTRFTYTRYNHFMSEKIAEEWSGTVLSHFIDELGEHTVEVRQDDGTTMTFWNGSFAGTPTESIVILAATP